jgi:hypothetical protein
VSVTLWIVDLNKKMNFNFSLFRFLGLFYKTFYNKILVDTNLNKFITEELFTKDLNTIFAEERRKQVVIKFKLKMANSIMGLG